MKLILKERLALIEWLESGCPCSCLACTKLRAVLDEIRKEELGVPEARSIDLINAPEKLTKCEHCAGSGPLRRGAHPTKHGKIAHENEIERLMKEADRSCRCDGGNTMGCRACVAERKLRELGYVRRTGTGWTRTGL